MFFAIIILSCFLFVSSTQYVDLKKDFDILTEKYNYGVRDIYYTRRYLSEIQVLLNHLSYFYIINIVLGVFAKRESQYAKLNCIKLITYLI